MTRTTVDEAKAIRETVRHLEGMNIKQWRSDYGNLTFGDIDRLCRSYLKLLLAPPSDAAQPEHTKLIQRIGEAVRRIGKMCSEGRPPKMSIPVRPEDDDIFISETLVQCRDVLRSRDAHPEDALGGPWEVVAWRWRESPDDHWRSPMVNDPTSWLVDCEIQRLIVHPDDAHPRPDNKDAQPTTYDAVESAIDDSRDRDKRWGYAHPTLKQTPEHINEGGDVKEDLHPEDAPGGPTVKQIAEILCPGYRHTLRGLMMDEDRDAGKACARCHVWAIEIRDALNREVRDRLKGDAK